MKKITEEKANKIYDILVKQGGALESERASFVYAHSVSGCSEWRFQGRFGFGGKYRSEKNLIDFYSEDETKSKIKLMNEINEALFKIA